MATSINSYSVSLGMDAKGYVDGSTLARGETRALIRDIESARTPAERYQHALDRLTTAKASNAIQTGTFIRLMDEEKRKLDAATSSANTHTTSVDGMASKVKALASAYVGMQTVTKSIRLAVDAEQASAAFEVLTGNINDAKLLGQQIRDFAAISPVSLSGAQAAAKTMLAFNIQVKDVQRNLNMLSDISAGNQQRFDSLTLAFSQMSAAGRLMGQDLLQFVNAGFNPLQEISRKTGESLVDLKARMEDGKISTEEVTAAFISATSEGGKFNGMTEKMAETMGGKLAIAAADLELQLTKVGTALGPVVIALTDGTKDGTSALDDMVMTVSKLSEGLGAVVASARDLNAISIFQKLTSGGGDPLEHFGKYLDMLAVAEQTAYQERNALTAEPTGAFSEPVEKAKQIKMISAEMLKKWQDIDDKMTDDWLDELDKEEKKRLDAIEKQLRASLNAADAVFERERTNANKLRDEIAKGPVGGFEAGSQEAAKFMADQVNRSLAGNAVQDVGKPTEDQILEEARKQYELAVEEAKKTDVQTELLKKLVEKTQPIGKAR